MVISSKSGAINSRVFLAWSDTKRFDKQLDGVEIRGFNTWATTSLTQSNHVLLTIKPKIFIKHDIVISAANLT